MVKHVSIQHLLMMVMLLKYIGNKNGGNDMRMMPIASGSSGNCIYVGSDDTHILIAVSYTHLDVYKRQLLRKRMTRMMTIF